MEALALSTREAARACGISESKLEKLRLAGEGPRVLKVGRRVLYRLDDLKDWLATLGLEED